MKTLDQERAEFAWEKAKKQCESKNDKEFREYRNLVKSAPAMVMANGLMQTLAFLKGKGKSDNDPFNTLINQIQSWLKKKDIISGEDFSQMMETLYRMKSHEYQMATEETIAILRWLRQFVDAVS